MRVRTSHRRGVVNVWVALVLFMLIGLVGLACDAGWSVLVLAQLQSAADASALAGARLIWTDQEQARQAALTFAAANKAANTPVHLTMNGANDDQGDIVLGRFDRKTLTFTPTNSNPNAVKVIANRTSSGVDGPVPLVFGPIFGVDSIGLSRTAIAMIHGSSGAGMLVLHPTRSCSLNIGGNGDLVVNDGAIQVNSENSCAVCNNGNPSITTSDMYVVGSSCLDSEILDGLNHNNSPVIPDPLAWLPAPLQGITRPPVSKSGNASIQPGHYPEGIERTGGVLNMEPGIYTLDGKGFDITGTTSQLIGHGVTLYVRNGPVRLNGGSINLSPPDPAKHSFPNVETYEHVTIFQARANTVDSYLNGNNTLDIRGTLYFPNALVHLNGTGASFANQMIAERVAVGGNGVITINYDGAFPTPIGGNVYLVD